MMRFTTVALVVTALLGAMPVLAQDKAAREKPADNMQILRNKIKADKKLVVAANMELTESEAKGFWAIYESYQKEIEALNQRIVKLIKSYAADYNAKTLSDDKAKMLINEAIAIDEDEAKLRKSYVPKLSKVLPGKKVARYLQIENKLRAIVKYELAEQIPLVP